MPARCTNSGPTASTGPARFDQSPLAHAATDVIEKRPPDRLEVGRPAQHNEHGHAERRVQRRQIDHVEARERDALQQHGVDLREEARTPDDRLENARRVRPVAPQLARQHAVQPAAGEHGADDEDVTTMLAVERRVVERDDVTYPVRHRGDGACSAREARRKVPVMTPLHELLSRIRWDAEFGAAQFVLGYYDRVARRIVRVDLRDFSVDDENHSMLNLVDEDGNARSMPMHRIKEVFRNDQLIWHREH